MSKKSATSSKFENNWLTKSLENLEKSIWPPLDPDEGSYLIKTCNHLRKKQLQNFSTEDLRIMIGQDIGLKFLIPVAIKTLTENILAEGDLYPGDLLKCVLTSDKDYWQENRDNWTIVCELFEKNMTKLEAAEVIQSIKKDWTDNYSEFKKK